MRSILYGPDDRPLSTTFSLERPRPLPRDPGPSFAAIAFGLQDRWSSHPGAGLTPRRIVEIYRAAEGGFPQQQCDLFEDVRESDGHLRSQVEGRIDAVAGKPWILQAGGEAAADVRAAELLEAALRRVPNISETIAHQLEANWYGWSASGIWWDRTGGLTVPVWFSNVPHRRLVFALEHDEPRLTTTAEPTRGVPLEPGRWWFSRRMHRLTAAAGLARTATWWALFKRLSARDWVIFAERFGLPYVTGEYDERASDEDKAVLAKAAQSLGKDGSAIFSEACKLVVHEVQRSGSADGVHGSLIALCNAEISKLLAGSTLTSETGGPGSFALGRVHENRSFDLVMSDAERLAIRFEQDVGLPFVFFNGMAARPPRLKVHVVRQYDPEARMRLMSAAANELGLALDEEQVRQEFQLRRPGTGGALVGTGQRSGRSDTRSDTRRSE